MFVKKMFIRVTMLIIGCCNAFEVPSSSCPMQSPEKTAEESLFDAIEHNNRDEVMLQSFFADLNARQPISGFTPLQLAIVERKVDIFKFLLPISDPNYPDSWGNSALILATDRGSIEMVQELLNDPRTDVNFSNKGVISAIGVALHMGDPTSLKIAKMLHEKGASLGNLSPRFKLAYAIYMKNLPMIETILSVGNVDINKIWPTNHHTLLIMAVLYFPDAIPLLLAYPGIDPNIQNSLTEPALFIAVQTQNEDAVRLLLKDPRIDINVLNWIGQTPLSLARHMFRFSDEKSKRILIMIEYRSVWNRRAKSSEEKSRAQEPRMPVSQSRRPQFDISIYEALGVLPHASPRQILDISASADATAIKEAYKNKTRQWHPDRNKDPRAADVSKLIRWAYESLTGQ